MATPDLTSGQVMDAAAAAMNDSNRETYTYTIQVPYLNMALRELQEEFELNNIPVTDESSAVINIPAGQSVIQFPTAPPIPKLPSDLIEPKLLWERSEGIDPYIPMTRVDTLNLSLAGTQISQFGNYVWEGQKIKFLPANQDNDIKLTYIRQIFTVVTDGLAELNIINGLSFLAYRTASLMAELIEENEMRADKLNGFAGMGLDRVLGVGTKGRQRINTRRRPFRQGYKQRGY